RNDFAWLSYFWRVHAMYLTKTTWHKPPPSRLGRALAPLLDLIQAGVGLFEPTVSVTHAPQVTSQNSMTSLGALQRVGRTSLSSVQLGMPFQGDQETTWGTMWLSMTPAIFMWQAGSRAVQHSLARFAIASRVLIVLVAVLALAST